MKASSVREREEIAYCRENGYEDKKERMVIIKTYF
jgi:hypothetical protein